MDRGYNRVKGKDGAADERIAIFPVTERGASVARGIARGFVKAVVFKPGALKKGGLAKKVRSAFQRFKAIVFVSAAGIAVRTVAPLLKDKTSDPAVIVVDERGRFAISLVSGHLGGANDLTRKVSSIIKAAPVITTATDLAGLPCIEDVARRFSLAIEDKAAIKAVNSAILAGKGVLIADGNRERLKAVRKAFGRFRVFTFSKTLSERPGIGAAAVITNKRRYQAPEALRKKTLILRPRDIVAGMGCRKGTSSREIERAIEKVFKEAGLSRLSIRNIATVSLKRRERGLVSYARREGVGLHFFTPAELDRVQPPSGPSKAAIQNLGVRAVAEPAALLSSGALKLCVKKAKTKKVTVAIAEAPFTSLA